MYDVNSSSVPDQLIFRICSRKSPEFTLIVHVHQHLSIFVWNTLHVIFIEMPCLIIPVKYWSWVKVKGFKPFTVYVIFLLGNDSHSSAWGACG